MKFLPSAVQKLSSEQTDKQTDLQILLKLLPTAYADGKKSYGALYTAIDTNGVSLLAFVVISQCRTI